MSGWDLLSRHELQRYRDLIPEVEDCQKKWEVAMDDPEKYVSLLVGQKDDDEQQEELDEENYHDPFEAEQTTQNYFLVYHEVKAHLRFVASRSAEAEAYKRFQVGECLSFFLLSVTCRSSMYCEGVAQSAGGGGQSPGLSFGV